MKVFKHVKIGLLVMFLIAPALALTASAAGNKAEGKSPQVNEKNSKMVYNETMEKPGRQKAVDSRPFDDDTPHGPNQSGHLGSTTTAPSAAIPGADNLVKTYYIYSYDGKLLCEYDHNGNCVKNYIYIGNRLLAEYHPQTDKYYYYTIDQVNSTRVITDDNGNVVYSAAHGPYGQIQKTWTNTYDPKLKYSGKEREGYSDLDYFGARHYAHDIYRFISVDPIINREEALFNPQLWNGYSFCRNNPIAYLDPDGREEKKSIWKQLKGIANQIAPKNMVPENTMMWDSREKAPKTADESVEKAIKIAFFVGTAVIVVDMAADSMKGGGSAEHKKNARPSTKNKHQEGRARVKKDHGGEKGDIRRRPPRKKPTNWKGPWPPKSQKKHKV
jgi:RHS repeat-associated protein